MIEISHLTKRRGQRAVVDDVSFVAHPGKVTGFLGPNGAGKSSTLRILLGLDRATSGSALIEGKSYRQRQRPLLHVGAMLDGPGANRGRTVRGHLAWVAQSNGIARRRTGEVLELVGLSDAAGMRVRQLSLGMGQRLGIAAALLGDPSVLVLDEPTNGLDPAGIRWVRNLLRDQAHAGRTVLVSSHILGEMESIVDDVVVIARGSVVARGSALEVTGSHPSLESAFFSLTGGEE